MKIAILIGVDTYSNSLGDLPACRQDVNLIKKVIEASGEFSNILCISDNCTSDYVKSTISDFVTELKGSPIDEIFFYFTGHGDFYEQQFYYVLSDYNSSKRKQTSLENSEVDNWLRSLNPKLTIKVVDACHSGTTYIKSESAINEHLEKSTSRFENCYFMFSSNQNQASYQDNSFSFFTRSFLRSLEKEDGYKIRYKDIIDFVSDEFDRSTSQTPIFVTQGTFTEIFCISNNDIIKLINPVIIKSEKEETVDETDIQSFEQITLTKIIQEDAKQYCEKDEVEIILEQIKKEIENSHFSNETAPLFNLEFKFESHDKYERLANEVTIGDWIDKNGESYFAEPTTKEVAYETEVPDHSIQGMMGGGYRTKTKYRSKISGFKTTVSLSYDLIKIDAEPHYPNIPPFNCTIAILVSKKAILLFYFFSYYQEKNWEKRELRSDFKWRYSEVKLKNRKQMIESVTKILKDFDGYIYQHLLDWFKKHDK